MKSSIFAGQGLENIQRRYQESEELIYVGPHDEVVTKAFIQAVSDIERFVNKGLQESGVRIEIDARWCNILDSRTNPKGEYGFVSVLMHREKIPSQPETF